MLVIFSSTFVMGRKMAAKRVNGTSQRTMIAGPARRPTTCGVVTMTSRKKLANKAAQPIAANSLGFEAQWLTAWYIYRDDCRDILGLADGEQIAGIIHIGTNNTPKTDRPRPDIDSLYSIRES